MTDRSTAGRSTRRAATVQPADAKPTVKRAASRRRATGDQPAPKVAKKQPAKAVKKAASKATSAPRRAATSPAKRTTTSGRPASVKRAPKLAVTPRNRGAGESSEPAAMTVQSSKNSPAIGGGTTTKRTRAPRQGAVERQTRADVKNLKSTHPMAGAIAESAFTLARALDRGAGLAIAAVSRELRANLVELSRLGADGDPDVDADLSTAVGHPAQS